MSVEGKRSAAYAAADLVDSGMRLGLGSGSTFAFVLERLAERIQSEGLQVVGVPTSDGTAARARQLGIPLTDLDSVGWLDLTIDGADEIDPHKHMIKGGGAALVREKIVASAANEMVVVVDASKCVQVLGAFALPVEVLPFGWKQAQVRLQGLGAEPVSLRHDDQGQPLLSNNGNHILDCNFTEIPDPVDLEGRINLIPGVLDNGLFTHRAGRVFVGATDGTVTMRE